MKKRLKSGDPHGFLQPVHTVQPGDAVQTEREIQIFLHVDGGTVIQRIRHEADFDKTFFRIITKADAVQKDIAFIGQIPTGKNTDGCAFAGSVRSDKAGYFPRSQME